MNAGIDTTFSLFPVYSVPKEIVEYYFQTLYMHGWLQYRFSDIADPQWDDVKVVIARSGQHMYLVFDSKMNPVAEFMLENFTGAAAQVHFSMHPENSRQRSLQLASDVTDLVLRDWKDGEGQPYLRSIFGLTPVPHRAATRFIQRCGFKKIGILPGGVTFMGRAVDALITVKEA